MIIVHIIIGLDAGGAELMLKRLILSSHEKNTFNHQVISLTNIGPIGKELQKSGVKIYSLGMNSIFTIPLIYFRLKKILKVINPNIVQTWMYHADFLGGVAAKRVGIKKIIWGIRTTDVTLGKSNLTILLRNLCAKFSYFIPKVIVSAARISKTVHIEAGYDASKFTIIPNGFDMSKMKSTPEDRELLRKEWGINHDDIVIGSIGRFNYIKNQQLFIEIAAKLNSKKKNLKFIMIGKDNDWENHELLSWIDEYGIREKFILLGQRNDINKCLSALDFFCLHSRTEGFPNVLGEAMAMGVIPVCLDVGDVAFILNKSELIAKNPNELFEAMIKALELNPVTKEKIIKENYFRIKNNFSLDLVTELYEKLYQEI
ncbi:glycosyltransferase [Acinetobacter gerneri]|uniref:glycosyltransferase family 4 protein n=1 Tax=Acinetobacter gerneri TaxID=202952 RepID=UPI002935C7F4|nr:glycosyltransferase [Acinetobacter gerneri]MDV2440809.1 glycosyltransferase [Acinetobacter gerneri]